MIKGLLDQKSAPIEVEFATFIPSSSSLSAHAFLGQKDALALQGGAAGMITIAGQEIPFTVRKIAQTPSPQNRYQITLDLGKQAGSLKFGQTLQARIISYEQEEAIVVKKKALRFSQDGWRVEVKLADGTTEWRQVTRGKASGDQVEITAGLELGQVIIVP